MDRQPGNAGGARGRACRGAFRGRAGARFSASTRMCTGRARRSRWPSGRRRLRPCRRRRARPRDRSFHRPGRHDRRAGRSAPAGRSRGDRRRLPERIAALVANWPTRFPIFPARNARIVLSVGNSRSAGLAWASQGNAALAIGSPGSAPRWRRSGAMRRTPGREPVSNFDRFARALAAARFPVFLFSGHAPTGLRWRCCKG